MKTALNRLVIPVSRTLALLLAIAFVANRANAADRVWNGGGSDNNWSTPANWSGGVAPAPSDFLYFAGSVRTSPNNDYPAGTVFKSITFVSGASAFTIAGNAIILTNGSSSGGGTVYGGSITNASASTQTISFPITISAGQHYIATLAGSGVLNLSGAITRNSGATVAFSRLGGNINVSGTGLAPNNNILGGWATFGGVNATNWATLDGGGNIVGLSGGGFTTVAGGGTIASSAGSNVRVTPSGAAVTLAAGGTTELNSLLGAATGANQVVDVGSGNTLRLPPLGGVLNATPGLGTTRIFTVGATAGQGFLTAGGADNTPGELFFIDTPINSGSGNNLVINPVVMDNGSGVVTMHIQGYVQFNSAVNTFSGGTFINQGRVQAGGVSCFGTGPVYVFNGGHIFLNVGNGTWSNDFFIAGVGSPESGGIGAIRMGGNRTISGTVTLMETASTGNGTIAGRITGPGGLIVGSGSANGSGTLTVGSAAGANDYNGDTIINNSNPSPNAQNVLRINTGRPNVMPHGVGKGNLILNGVSPTVAARFDLNGSEQTINGLSSTGLGANTAITNSAAGTITLTLGDADANGDFGGQISAGSGDLAITKIGTGTQTLLGANTFTGPTTVSSGKLVTSTASTGSGAITVVDGATLGVRLASAGSTLNSGTLTFGTSSLEADPGSFGIPSTPIVNVTGELTLNGNVSVILTRGDVGTFTLLQYTAFRSGPGLFVLGTLPPRTIGTLLDDVANQRVTVTITAVEGALTWVGDSAGNWDINNPLNLIWKNTFSGLPRFYQETVEGNDAVRFDDSATGATTVNLTTTLSPNGVVVDNSTLNYTFAGAGRLGGANGLIKRGTGTLILDNVGANDFAGGVNIGAGTVQVGSANANGSLGSGGVVNNGALVFARSDNFALPNGISGSGSVAQNGSGILTLAGANSHTGATVIAQGTLKAGTATALGTVDSGTTVTSGATLDVNGQNLGAEAVTVSGAGVDGVGAIINTGAQQINALRFVTLAGDTTIGGPGNFLAPGNPGRWDIRLAGGSASLLTGGNAYSLTKVGSNQIALVGVTVDAQLGDVTIKQGLMGWETTTTSMGDPFSRLTVEPGATLSFFNSTALWNKLFVLHGDGVGPSVTNWSGSNTMVGPVTLNGQCVIGVAGTALVMGGQISGSGSLTKRGASPLTLSVANDFTGSTIVDNGTLFIDGSLLGPGGVRVGGGTLGGVGVIDGAVSIGTNGNIGPGNVGSPISAMQLGGSLTLEGTCTIDVNKANPNNPILINDQIIFGTGYTFGGTLRLNITGPALAAGDAFPIFNFSTATGAFSRIEPATPGPGLVWDTTGITIDGTLRVALPTQPGIASISVMGENVVLSGTNGTPGSVSYVLSSTNVAQPLLDWARVGTNVFDAAGKFNFTNAVDLTTPQRFFLLQLQ